MTKIIRQAELYKAIQTWVSQGFRVTLDTLTGQVHIEPPAPPKKKDRLSEIEI